jgi:hypothetical protein
MGASQSTRDIPDPVFVSIIIQPDQTIKLELYVYDTDLRYKIRKHSQETEVLERNRQPLPPPVNSRDPKAIYLHLHTDASDKLYVGFHVTQNIE